MNSQEYSPRRSLEHVFARWWIIVLMTVLGGVVGWSFHFFKPPVYEASAVITINIDFTKRELTQYEEDYAFSAAGAIITSAGVTDQVIAAAQAQSRPIDTSHLYQQMFMEGKQSVWELKIRNQDPQVAAALANIWGEKAESALNVALSHAVLADHIQNQIDAEKNNLSETASQITLTNLSDEFVRESNLSKGVLSIMSFALTSPATVPDMPALYNLGNLVLAGASIGFIISLWVVNSYKVQRRD